MRIPIRIFHFLFSIGDSEIAGPAFILLSDHNVTDFLQAGRKDEIAH